MLSFAITDIVIYHIFQLEIISLKLNFVIFFNPIR